MQGEVHNHFKTANYILLFLLVITLLTGVYAMSLISGNQGIVDFISITYGIWLIIPSAIFIGLIILYLKLQSRHYDGILTDNLWIILLSVFIFFMVCLMLYGAFLMLIFIRISHWMFIITLFIPLVAIGNIYFPASMIYHIKND